MIDCAYIIIIWSWCLYVIKLVYFVIIIIPLLIIIKAWLIIIILKLTYMGPMGKNNPPWIYYWSWGILGRIIMGGEGRCPNVPKWWLMSVLEGFHPLFTYSLFWIGHQRQLIMIGIEWCRTPYDIFTICLYFAFFA